MKRAGIFTFLVFSATFLFAQKKKADAPIAATSQPDCTMAFYIQDSVAVHLSGYIALSDSAVTLRKTIDSLKADLMVANDKMLHQQNDSTVSILGKELHKKSLAAAESRNITDEITSQENQLNGMNQKMQTRYYDTIASVAKRVALSQNIMQLTEINSNWRMNCPTDQMIMVDITEAIVAELKQD